MNRNLSIIVVEDEPVSALLIRMNAEALGYRVAAVCSSGEQALKTVADHPCHVAIIDIDLDGNMDGIQLAVRLMEFHRCAVIFVSSYSEQKIFDEALPLLPIAYLVKPFKAADLRAAMMLAEQALLRRNPSVRETQWIDLPSPFRYNRRGRVLFSHNLPVELTPLEKKLLSLLIDHHGSCVSCDQILASLWNGTNATVDSLRSLVRRFHQKLGRNLITNIYAKGYKIDLPSVPHSFDI